MTSLQFSDGNFPHAPKGMRLRSIRFQTCPAELDMSIIRDVDGTLDSMGIPADFWVRIITKNVPDRTLRMFRGSHSLHQICRRYGFLDSSGCMHHKDAIATYASAKEPLEKTSLRVPPEMQSLTGVPQMSWDSGVCWFAAVCWNSFLNKEVSRMICRRLPFSIQESCSRCLACKEDARAVRNFLWHEYHVGDDVTQDPKLDGRNGFREFMTLCAKIKVPIILYYRTSNQRMELMKPFVTDRRGKTIRLSSVDVSQPHLLALRYSDDHTPPSIFRRLELGGRRYKLVGMYMGSKACGHQIGSSCYDGNWRSWSITDADLHKDGVGPIFVDFLGPQWVSGWKDAWKDLVPVTKYGVGGSKACSLSPRNVDNRELTKFAPNTVSGKATAVDLLYLFSP